MYNIFTFRWQSYDVIRFNRLIYRQISSWHGSGIAICIPCEDELQQNDNRTFLFLARVVDGGATEMVVG